MSLHKEAVMQKFEEFKKYFGETIDQLGDTTDSFQILIQKHGFNLEEKLHAKGMTRVKKAVLELLMKLFDTFKDDLRIHLPEGVEEFEVRVKRSLEKTDRDLSDLDKY